MPNLRSYYNQYNRPSSGNAGAAVPANSNANLATSNNQASQSNSYSSNLQTAKSQQNSGLNLSLERTNHQVNQAQQLLAQSFNGPNDETANNQNIQSNQKLASNQNGNNFDEPNKAFQSFNDYQPYGSFGSASVRSNQSPAQISFETNGLDGKYFETPKYNIAERKRERTRTRPNPPQVNVESVSNQSPPAVPAERTSMQRGSTNQYSNQNKKQPTYLQNNEPASSSGHLAYPASRLRNKSGNSGQQDENYKKVIINSYSELDNSNNKKHNKYDQTRTPATEFKLTNSRTTYLTTTAVPITYKIVTESTTNAFTRSSLSINNPNSNEDNEEILLNTNKHSPSSKLVLNEKAKENQLDKDLRTTNYQRSFNSRSRSRYKEETNTRATLEASRTTNLERSNQDMSVATYREDNTANAYDPANYENEDYENRHKSNEYENTAPPASSSTNKQDQARSKYKNPVNNQPAAPADYEYESEDPNDDQANYYDKYNANNNNNYGGSTPILTTTSTTTTTTTTTQPPQISTTVNDNRPRRGRFGNGPRGRLGRRRQRAGICFCKLFFNKILTFFFVFKFIGRRTTTTSTTTTTTTSTTTQPPLPDYYDYDDNYYDYDYNNQLNKNNQQQTSTTTTTTTLKPPFHPARGTKKTLKN